MADDTTPAPREGSLLARVGSGLEQVPGTLLRFMTQLGEFVWFVIRRFYQDGLGTSAGSLTYATLLALVPLLVISFAILSGFAAFDPVAARMEALFFDVFVPDVGTEVENYLSRFSGNASNLTAVGIVALAVTAVLLLFTIEGTLNEIWRVEQPRTLGVRLLIYWTVLTLGPLLLGASFALTSGILPAILAWFEQGQFYDRIHVQPATFNTIAAIVTQALAFTLLYKLVPARHVHLRDAAIGGIVSAVAFHLLRWGFNSFVTSGSTYETIYGALAVLPIFLFWIYCSWTVIILGAVFAAAFPDWWKTRDAAGDRVMSPARRLEVAVAILGILAHRTRGGATVPTTVLQDAAPLQIRDETMEALARFGYLVVAESGQVSLARDLHCTRVADLAHDLGLALGLDPQEVVEEGAAATLEQIEEEAGRLPRMLAALHQAEARILGPSLADVLGIHPPTRKTETDEVTTLSARKTQRPVA